MSYVYLMASLPLLSFTDPAPLSMAELESQCSGVLPGPLLSQLVELVGGAPTSIPVVNEYRQYQQSLDNELATFRARALGRKAELSTASFKDIPVAEATEIMHAHNPKEAQQVRWYALWSKLKELHLGHYMDQEDFFLYALQLQLLLEKEQYNLDAGRQNVTAVVKNLLESVG